MMITIMTTMMTITDNEDAAGTGTPDSGWLGF